MPETIAAMTVYEFLAYVAVAFSVASTLGASMKSIPDQSPKTIDSGQMQNTRLASAPLPLVYGRTRIGGNIVYLGTSGADNQYLHVVLNLGEGPMNGVAQTGGVDQIFLGDELWTAYSDLFHYEFFSGAADQSPCATLHTAIPEWNEAKRNTAYLYARLKWDRDRFQNLPTITVEVEGLKVYDPDTETAIYSRNPALHALDFMTRSARRGGMGIDIDRVDLASVLDAVAYCDAKGWTCDLYLSENQSASDNFIQILATFRGLMVYSEASFKLKYRDLNYESSVMEITEDDIAETSGSTLRVVQPSIFSTPNAVRCKYNDAEKNYTQDDFVLADSDAATQDGGDYREEQIELFGISSQTNVMKMANYFLERLRLNKTADFTMGTRGIALEPFDIVTLTHSRPGWDGKMFRVTVPIVSPDGTVAVSLEEEYASFYDDDYNLSEHSFYDTSLPRPSDVPPSVINVSHAEEVYNYRDRSFTRWKIDFDKPDPAEFAFWDYADIWLKVGDGDWKFMTKSEGDYYVDPVEEGVDYACKIVSVSIFGTKEDFNSAYTVSHRIQGKTSAPTDISSLSALAAGDTVTIFATQLSESDISGYEVRMGDAWEGGLYIAFNETPNIRITGMRPGTHVFWMKAKDNSGNYSDIPASAVVTVFYPPGYADKNTWSWDFDAIGTHENTEHTTYNESDALKCSHTAGVLEGTWTSPEYDLGSVKKVRIWGDFATEFESSTGTWEAVFPGTTTWGDKTDASTRWYELLQPEYAGKISAILKWGDSSGSLSNSTDKLDILGIEIEARYVQVEVTITDPDNDSNLYLKTLNMTAAYWS